MGHGLDKATRWSIGVWLGLCLLIFKEDAMFWIAAVLGNTNLAAWVQALGSIASIWVAIFVVNRQAQRAVQDQRLQRLGQARAHIHGVMQFAAPSIQVFSGHVHNRLQGGSDVGIYRFDRCIQMLESLAAGQMEYLEVRVLLDMRAEIDRIRLLALCLRDEGQVDPVHVKAACEGLHREFKKTLQWLNDKEYLINSGLTSPTY
jgi:hypothetical protein